MDITSPPFIRTFHALFPTELDLFKRWPMHLIEELEQHWRRPPASTLIISSPELGRLQGINNYRETILSKPQDYVWIVLPPIRNFEITKQEDSWELEKKLLLYSATRFKLEYGLKLA